MKIIVMALVLVTASSLTDSLQQEVAAQSRQGCQPTNESERRSALGEKYYVMGNKSADRDPEQAVAYYRMAIEKGYDTNHLRVEMGILLRSLKRYEESSEQFRVAIKRNENDGRAHLSYAYTLMAGGNYEEALKEWEAVKRRNPDDYASGIMSDYIAQCFDALGKYEEALKEYEAALRCCGTEEEQNKIKKRVQEIKELLNKQ